MGITSVLPNTPGPNALAVVALVVLALVLVGRLAARSRATAACESYKYGLIVTTLALGAGFTAVAFAGILETPNGSIIALLGGILLAVLTALVALVLLRRPGSLFKGRIPMALLALLALTMYVAIVGYVQTVFSNAAGSVAGSTWWNMYKVALVVADALSIIVVLYLGVLFVIWLVMVPIKTYRRRKAAATASSGTP